MTEEINKEKRFRIECDCGSLGHFIAFEPWSNEPDEILWHYVVEAGREMPFFHRLKYGLKYILGLQHLNEIEVVMKKNQLEDLKKYLNSIS